MSNLHDDIPEPPISVPDNAEAGEGGKLKMIVQLVKKCLGVKDIASMRLSLPASLLEPIPNLEYWHYLDRPDLFAAINDSPDPFERMLAVVRFAYSKDLRYVHGKICKPYNSVLGEHFRAHWDVVPVAYPTTKSEPVPRAYVVPPGSSSVAIFSDTTNDNGSSGKFSLESETASVRSGKSSKSTRSGQSFVSRVGKSPSTAATSPSPRLSTDVGQMSKLDLHDTPAGGDGAANVDNTQERVRVVYVTEQVSHHPPVSAFYACCPQRQISMSGIDQISAKVAGTAIRIAPGIYNQGIFVNIEGGHGKGEKYKITPPTAAVNGILRGSFYATFAESTVVTCENGRFRAILEYKEESWLGRAHFLVEGVIHIVHPGETQHEAWTKVKHVPQQRVVATFEGTWRGEIKWRRVGFGSYPHTIPGSSASSSPSPSHAHLPSIIPASKSSADLPSPPHHLIDNEQHLLIDSRTLRVVPKTVRPIERQMPNESRRLWASVTNHLLNKEYSEATREKVAIEQRQRDEAAERRKNGTTSVPKYFEQDLESGCPALTPEGRRAVEEEIAEVDEEEDDVDEEKDSD